MEETNYSPNDLHINEGVSFIGTAHVSGCAKGSVRIGGDKFDEAIVNYIRRHFGMLIGLQTAEMIKKEIGVAYPQAEDKEMTITGRNISQGIPQSFVLSLIHISEPTRPY